ncbi:hypothetical protein AJ80_07803 [Polytolypa hystricis UAMH7299]|uniref:RRM domain-containing protein n=1 Tax=Polytolypa hystricis (strain UAMH7299) TaxID=1447883 RepID=A0A2B7XJ07_POLH7|nr:hypothetical protein AJ80_07803 [Polytolypa hystricis UAMH7299]
MAEHVEQPQPEARTPAKPTPSRRWVNSPNWRVKRPDAEDSNPEDGNNNRRRFGHNNNNSNNQNNSPFRSPNNRTHRNQNASWARAQPTDPSTPTKSPFNNTIAEDSQSDFPSAFSEGRRLYVGNMPYMAKQKDVEDLFAGAENEYKIDRIDISIDPFTGRNPSYCFVDLATKEQSDRAMEQLNGKDMLGRPVKIKLGIPKSNRDPPFGRRDPASPGEDQPPRFIFERWERNDASSHWYDYTAQGRRLFVGGLPKMPDQPTIDYEIRKLFYGFKVEAISKAISPHHKRPQPGHQYFLFVDLASTEEADAAIKALAGVSAVWGQRVQINKARGNSHKPSERDRWESERTTRDSDDKNDNQDSKGGAAAVDRTSPPQRSRWGPPKGFEDEAAASNNHLARAESPP